MNIIILESENIIWLNPKKSETMGQAPVRGGAARAKLGKAERSRGLGAHSWVGLELEDRMWAAEWVLGLHGYTLAASGVLPTSYYGSPSLPPVIHMSSHIFLTSPFVSISRYLQHHYEIFIGELQRNGHKLPTGQRCTAPLVTSSHQMIPKYSQGCH